MRAKIKPGAAIFHDHGFYRWPMVSGRQNADADTVFDVEKVHGGYELRADGFGRRIWAGEPGSYGSGAVHVRDSDALIEVQP